MTSGLVKGRLTYFCKNKRMAYQTFYDKLTNKTKVLIYVNIVPFYMCCEELTFDGDLFNNDISKLERFAEEHEIEKEERNCCGCENKEK